MSRNRTYRIMFYPTGMNFFSYIEKFILDNELSDKAILNLSNRELYDRCFNVYKEIIYQIFDIVDNDYDDFCMKLLQLPRFRQLNDIACFFSTNAAEAQSEFSLTVRSFGLEIYCLLQRYCNRDHDGNLLPVDENVEYMILGVDLNYLTILKRSKE